MVSCLVATTACVCVATFCVSDVLIAYVSRGLLSSLMEPKEVLAVISRESGRTPHHVIINTYAVIDGMSSLSVFCYYVMIVCPRLIICCLIESTELSLYVLLDTKSVTLETFFPALN